MNALLQSESLKLRSLRGTWVITGAVAVISAPIGVAQATSRPHGVAVPSLAEAALGSAQAVWFLVIVLAVLASAGEFQHRTARTTLLAAPRRVSVLLAKAIAAAVTGALLATLGAVASGVAALSAAQASGVAIAHGSVHAWAGVAISIALGALWAVLATGLGMLARSTALAITAVLLWRFVGEVLVPTITRHPGLSRYMPSAAAATLVGQAGSPALPVAGASALLLGFVTVICGAAALRFVRSDPA